MTVKKILLVEDNPADTRLAEMALEKYAPKGFALRHVECVQDALKGLSKEPFDVILLDLFLPDASGLDALAQIHSMYPHIPIIALTGLLDQRTALQAEHMGAKMYFCKDDLSWDKVIKAIKRLAELQTEGPREPAGRA